jgi:hypothetical protein
MFSRSSSWIIVFGGAIMFAGMVALLALLGQSPAPPDQLAAGSGLFSLGTLFIAGGVYLKARSLAAPARSGSRVKQIGTAKNSRRGLCQLCGQGEPVVQCQTHAWRLCAACLGSHYDSRSCVYSPIGRPAKGGSQGPLNPRWA